MPNGSVFMKIPRETHSPALRTVDSLWAIMIVLRFSAASSSSIVCCTIFSLSASSADVASSKIRRRGFLMSALKKPAVDRRPVCLGFSFPACSWAALGRREAQKATINTISRSISKKEHTLQLQSVVSALQIAALRRIPHWCCNHRGKLK